jgi:menaquinone-specific isochorismate synthase
LFHLRQAVAGLIEQIKAAGDSDVRVTQPVHAQVQAGIEQAGLVDWLEAQPHLPKFYWQSRDAGEEVAALGQLCTFSDPAPAYQLLQGEQRIWGGRTFDDNTGQYPDGPSSFFFLPQVELYRREHGWHLAVNLSNDREAAIRALTSLVPQPQPLAPVNTVIKSISHSPDFPAWQVMLHDALQRIENQQFKKVVLARQSTLLPENPVSAFQLLKASIEQNISSFHFLLTRSGNDSFLGSPPERLYLRDGLNLETEALAGTIGRGENQQQDQQLADWLVHDAKNLAENQYVVDDIVECLAPHAALIEVQDEAHLLCLRQVQHLKRKIHANLKPGVNGVHLLGALQPTAAVAGLPREEALQYILENEPFSRGWYAGSMGYISHQKAEFCVAIRSASVTDNQIRLYAGAGILPGSNAEFEWQELDRKMSTLLSLFNAPEPPTAGGEHGK